MGQRAGERCGARRPLWAAVAALVVLAGCGAGDGADADAEADAPTAPPTTAPGADGEDPTTGTTTPPTLPEGTVEVPIDDDLVARLPRLFDVDGVVSEDEAFDERLCDGRQAPAPPVAQARATYTLSDREAITIAAYRFASGIGPYYLSLYSEAVRACAVEAGDSTDLGLTESVGYSYDLTTTRGDAFIAVALRQDVLWVLFQESTAGRPTVDPSTVASFISAVEG